MTDTLSLVANLFKVFAVGSLGLFAGAMLTEAGLLVPYWRSLDAEAFHAWYRTNATRLIKFFGPLTWLAGLSTLASALLTLAADPPSVTWAAGATALILMVAAMFPLYFRRANASFVEGFRTRGDTAEALRNWAAWHWLRTVMSCLAFALAIGGL